MLIQRDAVTQAWPPEGRDPAMPRLLGGRLCLDFVNTIDHYVSRNSVDFLTDYPALVRWAWHAGAIGDAQAARVRTAAEHRPAEASAVFAEALAVRGALGAIFHPLAAGEEPPAAALARLATASVRAAERAALVRIGDGYGWAWPDEGAALDAMLWPVVGSAVDLLTMGELARIKECGGPDGCDWIFFDESKNRSRRWCSMEGCGSQAKMRRLYARQRAARA